MAHGVKGLTKIHREHPHCLALGEGRGGLSPPIWLNGQTLKAKLAPILFCISVNKMASNCINRGKYVDDPTVMEFVPGLLPHI